MYHHIITWKDFNWHTLEQSLDCGSSWMQRQNMMQKICQILQLCSTLWKYSALAVTVLDATKGPNYNNYYFLQRSITRPYSSSSFMNLLKTHRNRKGWKQVADGHVINSLSKTLAIVGFTAKDEPDKMSFSQHGKILAARLQGAFWKKPGSVKLRKSVRGERYLKRMATQIARPLHVVPLQIHQDFAVNNMVSYKI